jgi:hypothetical protein
MLIRIVANAYDLSPFSLGLEKDVNRNTGLIMALSDFRGAVVPMAVRIAEALTRDLLHGFLGWKDLQFTYKGLDDPDALTKVQIQQREYQMNAITPDEIRKEQGKPDLPMGWGKLNFGQYTILIAEATALVRAKMGGGGAGASGGMGGAEGQPSIMPGAGSYGSPGTGGGGMGPASPGTSGAGAGGMRLIGAGEFAPDDVQQMTPEEVQYYQEMGMLPPGGELMNQMDTMQPGILEQLTDELKEFLESQEEAEADDKEEPQKVTSKDEKSQIKKFKESVRTPTIMEQVLNDRYRMGSPTGGYDPLARQNQQPKARGKYPRSGGQKGNYK